MPIKFLRQAMPVERLQKFLSGAGIASRRRAETLISAGKVKINGAVAKLGDKVDPAADRIEVSGKVIKPKTELYYLAVYKPKGYITSRFDPKGRKSVYTLVPKELRDKLWTVGRLDFFTEGLILFTNDGELTQQLSHPKYEHDKEYEVLLNKPFDEKQFGKLKRGVEIGAGAMTSPAKIRVDGEKVFLTIHEGRKHQVRRMFEAIGFKVRNLKRVRLNKLELGDLPLGKYRMVKKEQII